MPSSWTVPSLWGSRDSQRQVAAKGEASCPKGTLSRPCPRPRYHPKPWPTALGWHRAGSGSGTRLPTRLATRSWVMAGKSPHLGTGIFLPVTRGGPCIQPALNTPVRSRRLRLVCRLSSFAGAEKQAKSSARPPRPGRRGTNEAGASPHLRSQTPEQGSTFGGHRPFRNPCALSRAMSMHTHRHMHTDTYMHTHGHTLTHTLHMNTHIYTRTYSTELHTPAGLPRSP